MPTRVFLVRHGATAPSAEDRFAGSIDVPLSDAGRDQVRRLAERLRAEPLAALYASPLLRTRETAAILAEPHGMEVRTVDALREVSHGRWEGKRRTEVQSSHPADYAHWECDPFSFAPPEGETGLQVTARALPALLDIVERHRGAQLAIVSHKATIRLILSILIGFDPRRYRDYMDQSPAALNILDFSDLAHARLTLFNDTSHYAAIHATAAIAPEPRLCNWWDEPKA
jgi:broad specificity phosphatase PhoE